MNNSKNQFGYFVETKLGSITSASMESRALKSLADCVGRHNLPFYGKEAAMLKWIFVMRRHMMSEITISRYTKKVNALWQAYQGNHPHAPSASGNDYEGLASVQSATGNHGEQTRCAEFRAPSAAAMQQLSRLASAVADMPDSAQRTAPAAMLMAVYDGGAPLGPVLWCKTADRRRGVTANSRLDICGDTGCRQTAQLTDLCSTTRRQYVFGYEQGKQRPKAMEQSVRADIGNTLRALGYDRLVPVSDTMLKALWIQAAMDAGVPDNAIHAVAGDVAHIMPCYAFLDTITAEASAADMAQAITTVADALNADHTRWYAMGLRPRVKPQSVTVRLRDCGMRIETYYPLQEIVKRLGGGKTRSVLRPYIAGVLFFKARRSQLPALFGHIADLAWPYRQSRKADAPYAEIADMATFQRRIRQLTPDLTLTMATRNEYQAGDRVRITGGQLEGFEGVVLTHAAAQPGSTRPVVLHLAITNSQSLNFTAQIESCYIEPI